MEKGKQKKALRRVRNVVLREDKGFARDSDDPLIRSAPG
jgi:hypothetical protein